MLKSKLKTSIFMVLAILSTVKAQSAVVEPIICEEFGGAINSSEESEDSGGIYGRITIQFDPTNKPTSVTVERAETPEISALNFTLDLKNAKIVQETIPHTDDVWGIESHEQIKATGVDGRSVIVNLNDHRYAGILSGSTVEIKVGKQKVSTSEIKHQVICMTPSENAEYEKEISGAIE